MSGSLAFAVMNDHAFRRRENKPHRRAKFVRFILGLKCLRGYLIKPSFRFAS